MFKENKLLTFIGILFIVFFAFIIYKKHIKNKLFNDLNPVYQENNISTNKKILMKKIKENDTKIKETSE